MAILRLTILRLIVKHLELEFLEVGQRFVEVQEDHRWYPAPNNMQQANPQQRCSTCQQPGHRARTCRVPHF